MPVSHVNRKHKTYYLHEGVSKTGKPKFFFSMKSDGRLATKVPEGFEVYENPNAQVFLRKIVPRSVTDDEIRTVELELKRHPHLRYCLVDVKGEAITVFAPNQDTDGLLGLLNRFAFAAPHMAMGEAEVQQFLSYHPTMRFVVSHEEKRTFMTQRWCYLGSIDDWFPIGRPDRLDALVREFVQHIGQESYFELM